MQAQEKFKIPNVKNLIVIASGKGGVGKSTIAVNLTLSLEMLGLKTALLDLDIYGPSIPTMIGAKYHPDIDQDNNMIPCNKYGVSFMSIGFLVKASDAAIWRGPMVTKALHQMLAKTNWNFFTKSTDIDYLMIDTPPGTGDIHLTLAQKYNINGAIIVSTPQVVALADAIKANDMFQKLHVPVLGIIENMSYHLDQTGQKQYIFGKNNVKQYAREASLHFLGEIPLMAEVAASSDKGVPIVLGEQNHIKEKYIDIAKKFATVLKDM